MISLLGIELKILARRTIKDLCIIILIIALIFIGEVENILNAQQ